ncbi:hypothetical protein J1N10_09560 [Carboxylicivirga sp. A043]|uniref:fimbrial biogenesis chaperone n=1 Tax=Carboxylicivirga litoralis TaxID=2816963 RepID=UPI0021CB96A1|nr:hypothetical protein [Carboxylicivirga sp. A043]MCU4156223.1 hypothetical protein [Carboxylicivirga sp. A043]
MKNLVFILMCLVLGGITQVNAQSVSVSPSRLYYKEALGGYKSQKIRVTNNGSSTETFQVVFNNFGSTGNKGKTQLIEEEEYQHGCSQWLSASPAFFELAPGVTQDVEIMLQVPNVPEANTARWAVANVKLSKENTGGQNGAENETGMQIMQTFQFLIHIFQTPPSVTYKEAHITRFVHNGVNASNQQELLMEVENTGETILDCAPYLDVVNLKTGESSRIKSRAFTVLPQGKRELKFYLPSALAKGKYSILGVVDYGSDTDLAGAELEIEIK